MFKKYNLNYSTKQTARVCTIINFFLSSSSSFNLTPTTRRVELKETICGDHCLHCPLSNKNEKSCRALSKISGNYEHVENTNIILFYFILKELGFMSSMISISY